MDNNYEVTDELLAEFMDGNTNAEETLKVLHGMVSDRLITDNLNLITNDMDTIKNGQFGDTYNYWQQTYPDSCAIMSQKFIMDQFGITHADGTPYTEAELVQYAAEHGYYQDGTRMCDIGLVMSDAGIPCTARENSTVFDLANELAQGHKVIVGVDSGELWHDGILSRLGQWFGDFFGGQPDHAIVVAGIDASDPANPQVIVDDPGSGEYHKVYPLKVFMDAWQDSSCFMCSTDIPAPSAAPGMANFDYQEMHIPEVASVDYDTFSLFHDMNQGIDGIQPVADLYSAFTDVAGGATLPSALSASGVVPHIDPEVLCDAFQQTALSGFGQLQNYDPLVWHNALHGDIGQNMLACDMHDMFTSQADYYESIGDHDTVSFLQQQADMMSICQLDGLDIDPASIYSFI